VKPTTGAAVQEALGRVGDAAVLERAETLRGVVTTIVSAYEVAIQARDLEIARLRALLSARDRQDQAGAPGPVRGREESEQTQPHEGRG